MFQDTDPQPDERPAAQTRKYFGMTQTQVMILAGLAAAVCLVFGVAGILLLRGGLSAAPAPVPQDTPIPQATATPFIIPTLTPTETFTPVPYEQLIPEGWVQFKTALVEIWMPKGFKQQKPKSSDDLSKAMTVDLEIVRPVSKTSLHPVIVIVSYQPFTGTSLDAYVEGLPSQLSAETRVAGKRKVTINSADAILMTIESKVNGDDVNDQAYLLLDGSTVWFIQYIAQLSEFFDLVPTFEQSIQTFRVVR